LSLGN